MATQELEQLKPYITLREPKEFGLITPVGAIFFDSGKKMAVVWIGSDQSLQCTYSETAKVDTSKINRKSGRVVDLGRYKEIAVVQVGLGAIEMGTFPSVRQKEPSSFARLRYKNPASESEEYLVLQEEQLLNLMGGEKGGLEVFYGGGVPEENALVIEFPHNEELHAIVAFLRPDFKAALNFGLDSVIGVYEFFRRLNKQLIEDSTDPLLQSVAKCFEKKAITLKKKGENDARLELTRAQLIAHAVLARKTRDSSHLDFIREHLPELRDSFFQRAIDALSRATLALKQEVFPDFTLMTSSLKPSQALELYDHFHKELGDRFGDSDDDLAVRMMGEYLLEVVKLIAKSHTREELEDASSLLAEIGDTSYGRWNTIRCLSLGNINSRLDTSRYFNSSGGNYYYISDQIIPWLQQVVNAKRAEVSRRELSARAEQER